MLVERMADVSISEAEARIVAHICGDGCICSYDTKRFVGKYDPPRKNLIRKEYSISYCNTEESLLDSFCKDMFAVYGRKAYKSKRNDVCLRAKWIYQRLKRFGVGKSREWFIADKIFSGEKPIIKQWLIAFFDDEAHVDLRTFRIVVNSVNQKGLRQIQQLLKKMRITKTSFKDPYLYKKSKIYRLSILKEDVERFRVYVGFNHPKKVRDLEELLDLRALTL